MQPSLLVENIEYPGGLVNRPTDFRVCALGCRDAAFGDLFFENPKGTWEKGAYTLEIKNKEIDVKIPIALGPEE